MRMIRALGVAGLVLVANAGLLRGQEPAAPDTSPLSLERARALALAQVPDNQGVRSGRLETVDGLLLYEFEIETAGPGHQEVRVDAHTGAILSNRHADDPVDAAAAAVSAAAKSTGHAAKQAGTALAGGAKQAGRTVAHGARAAGRTAAGAARGAAARVHEAVGDEDPKQANPAIPVERARAIAQAAVADAPVTAAELDRVRGVLVWRVDLNTPGKGYEEVLVDATTGQVVSQEHKR